MQAKFTKAPWKINEISSHGDCHIFSKEVGHIAILTAGSGEEIERNKANAHLISAAPDMYEAIALILTDWDNYDETGPIPLDDLIENARTALKKARGEA